jgi:hypothetical protein
VAECVIVHFVSPGWDELEPWLDARAARVDYRRWNYPEPFEPLLFAYEYADHRREFEPEDLERLCGLLGGYPSAALCLQLRRRHGERSCDAAAALTAESLRAFGGVADDTFANGGVGYWSLAELAAGTARPHGRFLDCYRASHREMCSLDAEPVVAPDPRRG